MVEGKLMAYQRFHARERTIINIRLWPELRSWDISEDPLWRETLVSDLTEGERLGESSLLVMHQRLCTGERPYRGPGEGWLQCISEA